MLPTETSGSPPVVLEMSLVGGGGGVRICRRHHGRDVYHSLRTLSELAETRRFNFGKTNRAFTKSECAWVVDRSCLVCGHTLGVTSDGE